jgi:L-threonylcarbamoyladenylate synthase
MLRRSRLRIVESKIPCKDSEIKPDLVKATQIIRAGGIVAHATEGVWGLACRPDCNSAIENILKIKGRDDEKGFLLLGSNAEQFMAHINQLRPTLIKTIIESWPGHITWILPNTYFSELVTGGRSTVACRVPDHKQARELCSQFGGPIISTSLNRSGQAPIISYDKAAAEFSDEVDFILPGQISGYDGPSAIYGLDGVRLR